MAQNPLSVWRARKAYEDFTGHKSTKGRTVNLDSSDKAGYRLGDVVGIAYEATRDGKTDQYFHRFKKAARPELVSRSDGKQLYIAGGKYHVTDRGIEDMPQLFVVNPSRRVKRRKTSRRRRTAGGQFAKNPTSRKRKAPTMARRRRRRSVRRHSYARNPVALAPRRRRRRMRRNPIRRVAARRYRRNPGRRVSLGGRGNINVIRMVLPAVMIGAGGVGVELLMGYIPLPAMLQQGPAKYATKGLIAAVAGWGIARFVNRRAGEAFALGGMAIAAHDAIKSSVMGFAPSLKFGQYMGGYNWDKYGYNMPSVDSYPTGGLGYYSPGSTMTSMGEYMAGGGQQFPQTYEPAYTYDA